MATSPSTGPTWKNIETYMGDNPGNYAEVRQVIKAKNIDAWVIALKLIGGFGWIALGSYLTSISSIEHTGQKALIATSVFIGPGIIWSLFPLYHMGQAIYFDYHIKQDEKKGHVWLQALMQGQDIHLEKSLKSI